MVRDCGPRDLQTLKDIGNLAWRGIHRMYRETYGEELFGILVPKPDTVKGGQIEAHCAAHPDWVVVCEEGSRIVGFATYSIDAARRIEEIGNNALDPDCGLKGIGQQMYAEVFRRANGPAGFTIRKEDVTYHMKL